MKILYALWQCSFGILQTVLGFILFLCNINCRHYRYHGAVITEWKNNSSVSLGLFVFVTAEPFFYEKVKNEASKEEAAKRLLVHEYGHTIQSLILGPLYLIAIGIPSAYWGFSPLLGKMRKTRKISYFSFYTESWANVLGEKVTGEISMRNWVID